MIKGSLFLYCMVNLISLTCGFQKVDLNVFKLNEPQIYEEEENIWWTEEELELLARVVYCEAGSTYVTDRHQQLVAQVVLNRVADSRFPNTIAEVIYAPGQYSCVGNTRWLNDEVPERCYINALAALQGDVECPAEVVYQANFIQGYEVYETYDTSYSITYFCKG